MNKEITLYKPPFCSINSQYQLIDFAVEHGFHNVEIKNLFELSTPTSNDNARHIYKYATDRGINVSCFSLATDLVNEDREERTEQAKRHVDIAKTLGSPYFHHTIAINYRDPIPSIDNFERYYAAGLDATLRIYDYVSSLELQTLYENQGFIFNGIEPFKRFLSDIPKDAGIITDIGNILFVEEDIESFITEFADRIAHYHIKNYKFTDSTVRHKAPDEFYTNKFNYLKGCFLDEGSIDFSSVFNCIRRTGHKGRFSLESTCNYDTTEQFHKDLAFLNHLIENNQTEGPAI